MQDVHTKDTIFEITSYPQVVKIPESVYKQFKTGGPKDSL